MFQFLSTDPELSHWFPGEVNPVNEGLYRVANAVVCELSMKKGFSKPYDWTMMVWRNGEWHPAKTENGGFWAFYPPSIIGAWQGRSKP